jgi:tetratricopeptide (TPR) repeat protein
MHPVASGVTGENYTDVLRELDVQRPSPALQSLRDAAARYEVRRGLDHLSDGDNEAAIRSLHQAMVHYTPQEIAHGGLPAEIAPLARGILDAVSSRGDEAHALAAARVLMAVTSPQTAEARHRFEEIHSWGASNRREFRPPWVAGAEEAEIYREVARIVPAPDVLERATTYQLDRRRTVRQAAQLLGSRRMTQEDFAQAQAAMRPNVLAAEIAVIYLRLGDIAGAADQIARLSEGSQSEPELGTLLRAIASGEGGADGLVRLAEQLQQVDASAAAGVCRRGAREFPHDGRFARCLASAAANEENLGLASAHIEAAAQLAPEDRRVLDVAIRTSAAWLTSELTSDDPAPGRRAITRTQGLLNTWRQHFHETPPINDAELETVAAQLELGQAYLPGATQHLERAMHASPPSRDAFLTLAEIAWRGGDARRALQILDEGMALPVQPHESDSTFRPTFELHAGLVARTAGDTDRATRDLTEAANSFDALSRSLDGDEQANAHFLRAMALDALGRTGEVRRELDAAVTANPESRDLAGRVITFCMARGRWTDAHDFARAARTRLTLDRTWQVYFGLWAMIATRVGGFDGDGGASDTIRTIAQSAGEHAAWTVRLAQRFHGDITRQQLEQYAADSIGHRAEAAFYEAMLEFGQHDDAAAERDLRATVSTNMLRYYEYDMAWEMVARGVPSLRTDPSSGAPGVGSAPTTAAGASSAPASPPPSTAAPGGRRRGPARPAPRH